MNPRELKPTCGKCQALGRKVSKRPSEPKLPLPLEILREICAYADVETCANLACTTKQWNAAAYPTLYRSIKIENPSTADRRVKVLRNTLGNSKAAVDIRRFSGIFANYNSQSHLGEVLMKATRLQSLEICFHGDERRGLWTQKAYTFDFSSHPHLEVMRVPGVLLRSMAAALSDPHTIAQLMPPSLKILGIQDRSWNPDAEADFPEVDFPEIILDYIKKSSLDLFKLESNLTEWTNKRATLRALCEQKPIKLDDSNCACNARFLYME
ncbi:uncharacterized protein GIQ15_01618 [Arthroderma uncinatum]|uniref:uncharacterized protein n=1 Tax=Arthroderma uncinatum TaxID=74035 RepID=UPI00144A68B5|nr:uncharacterized protein GIQ15_01618 [Arthroderma uncinatum]KAF3492101.1 hypothetical protein GIQ15_01618 [Arthroderma uncinatum]